jgi:hypothetical protein
MRSIDHHEQKHKIKGIRIHASGDFFDQPYFDAWLNVAKNRQDLLFYAYTKSLPYWQERKAELPPNLRFIASKGGKADHIIDKEGFRQAVIVQNQGEAKDKQLNIDLNDFLAAFGDSDFALLLHGTQGKEGGLHSQSQKNAKIIKDASARMKLPPNKIEKMLAKYTSPRPKEQPITFKDFNKKQ